MNEPPFRRIPFRLLQDTEAKLSYIAVYIAILKNINFSNNISSIKINDIEEIAGVEAKTVTRSINYLSRMAYVTHKKEGKVYIYNVNYQQDEKIVLYDATCYDNNIKDNDSAIYAKLLMVANEHNMIYYKITELSKKINVSFRTLKKSLSNLESQELLKYAEQGILVKNPYIKETPETQPETPTPPLASAETPQQPTAQSKLPPNVFIAPTSTHTPTAEKPIEEYNKSDWARYFKKARGGNYFTQPNDGEILMEICNHVGADTCKKVIDLYVNSNVPDQYKTPFYMQRSHVNKILRAIDSGATRYDQNAKYIVPDVVDVKEEVKESEEEIMRKFNAQIERVFGG